MEKRRPADNIAALATSPTMLQSAKLVEIGVTEPMKSARHASRSTPFVDVENEFCTTRVETFVLHVSSSVLLVHVDARSYTRKAVLFARRVSRLLNRS